MGKALQQNLTIAPICEIFGMPQVLLSMDGHVSLNVRFRPAATKRTCRIGCASSALLPIGDMRSACHCTVKHIYWTLGAEAPLFSTLPRVGHHGIQASGPHTCFDRYSGRAANGSADRAGAPDCWDDNRAFVARLGRTAIYLRRSRADGFQASRNLCIHQRHPNAQ